MTNCKQIVETPTQCIGALEEQSRPIQRASRHEGQGDLPAEQGIKGVSRRGVLAGGAGLLVALAGGTLPGSASTAHAAAAGAVSNAPGEIHRSNEVASAGLAQAGSNDMVMKIGVNMPGIGDTSALSLSYGMSNTVLVPGPHGTVKTAVADVSIVKAWDATSARLMVSCASGRSIREVVFSVPVQGGRQDTITLADVQVSSFEPRSASVDELNAFETPLLEQVTFRYAKISIDVAGVKETYTVNGGKQL